MPQPRHCYRKLALGLLLLLNVILRLPVAAAEWHATTNGLSQNSGTEHAPWDLASALDGRQPIAPGDTLWIHHGTYKFPGKTGSTGYPIRLRGNENSPLRIRAWRSERVTIDGGLTVQPPSSELWIQDLEITVSEPRPATAVPPDPSYANVNRPWGGLNVYSGKNCKFINLVIHDNSQGASWWTVSQDSEMHGCIIYDNGWAGTDRRHGHAIYTQNNEGIKTISDCLFTGGHGYTMHAYGSSRAYVNNYTMEGNVAWNGNTFLIGGGRPSEGIRVISNYLHGVALQIGYNAPTNRDCVLQGNILVNAGLTINHFGQVEQENNLLLSKNAPRPSGAEVILRKNKHDPTRAHLVVFNWERRPEVTVDVSTFLKPGDSFRLLNPRDFFGPAMLEGTARSKNLSGEFACFVLLRGSK